MILEYEKASNGLSWESKIITRSRHLSEIDLLLGNEMNDLKITQNDIAVVKIMAPCDGWTHEKLETINYEQYASDVWDAYLGEQWIGSSEV